MLKKNNKGPLSKYRWSIGQRASDKLTGFMGSWYFIILLFIFLIIWMIINVLMLIRRWDPYPFILLNLILSCLAAVQAPIILMSQNRVSQKDRLRAQYDYNVNKKAEKEIREVRTQLIEIKKLLKRKK